MNNWQDLLKDRINYIFHYGYGKHDAERIVRDFIKKNILDAIIDDLEIKKTMDGSSFDQGVAYAKSYIKEEYLPSQDEGSKEIENERKN